MPLTSSSSFVFSKDVLVFEFGPLRVVVVFLSELRVRWKVRLRFIVLRKVVFSDALQKDVSFDVVELCRAERDDRVGLDGRRLENVLD